MADFSLNSDDDFKVIDITTKDVAINEMNKADNCVFIFLTSGSMTITVNLKELQVQENGGILVMPSELVGINDCSDDFAASLVIVRPHLMGEAMVRLEITVIGEFFSKRLYGERPQANIILFFKNTLENLKLISLQPNGKYKYEQVLCQLRCLFCFVSNIIEHWQQITGKTENTQAYNRMDEHFRSFISLVSLHYKTSREVSFYADAMNLTPKYLNYIVSTIAKKTCKQIINNYVIMHLKNDLRYTNKTIQELTYEYNFANQSFLGSFFKKIVGVSPRKFRNDKEI